MAKFLIKKRLHLYFSSTRYAALTWDPKTATLTETAKTLSLERAEGKAVVDRGVLDYFILETIKVEVKKPEAQTLANEEEESRLFVDD